MAKAIRWQIPFISRKGTSYRIDIYDTYTGSVPSTWPVTLQAGETPFTTNEDASDDFFTPVRPSNGTISVIDPDGTLMEQLIPENNIDRLVRLVSISGNTTTIQWQGFLSCEAFSQEYIANAHLLDINVNSVIDAMDSVTIPSSNSGMLTFREIIALCLQQTQTQSGYTIWSNTDNIYLSATAYRFIERKINMSVFFTENEQTNENTTTYVVSSMSAKKILNAICVFMGMTLQECGKDIYFVRKSDEYGMRRYSYSGFIGSGSPTLVNNTNISMSSLPWTGTEHIKSVSQGAKSVEVIASLDTNKLDISVPSFPNGTNVWKQVAISDNDETVSHNLLTQNTTAYSNITFAYYKADYDTYGARGTNWAAWNIAGFLQKFMNNHEVYDGPQESYHAITSAAGATYAKNILNSTWSVQPVEWDNEGIFCTFLPMANDSSENNPILTMRNNFGVFFNTGFIYLHCNADLYAEYIKFSGGIPYGASSIKTNIPTIQPNLKIRMRLRIGNKYLKCENEAYELTYSWVTEPTDFYTTIIGNDFIGNWTEQTGLKERSGIILPISEELKGDVELRIYPEVFGYEFLDEQTIDYTRIEGILFNALSVDYILPENDSTSRNANHFFQLLGTNFRDEISVNTMFASYFKNNASPSIIMVDNSTTAQNIVYTKSDGTTETRRPERDLLARLASYYSYARRKLELEAEHPTAAALPMLTVTGYDNKTYIPIAESRNWQEDTATLTLMES